jgi:nucleotide-binding universal stress UspA family protein
MKAFWAFDPSHQDKTTSESMYALLTQFAGESNIEVGLAVNKAEPLYNLAFDVPLKDRFTAYPKSLIKKSLRNLNLNIVDQKIHVVNVDTFSTTQTVNAFLKLAKRRKADLIGIFSHGRKGLVRYLMGSFAETAIHKSKTDVLVMRPGIKNNGKVQKILMACDFGKNAKKEIQKAISYCQRIKSELVVVHHAELRYKISLDETSPAVRSYRKKINMYSKWVEETCKKAGVKTEVVVNNQLQATSGLILNTAKETGVQMIIICAKSSVGEAFIGGSVTRQVLRETDLPVLILK